MRAAATGVSMAIGAGLGVVFTGISSHWLLNSSIPTWSVKKLADEFDGYLSRREELIAKGHLSEADAERIKFERDIARRIGAPLLGAFSFASGAVMLTNVLNPKNITGFPIGSIIGGNPLLEGVWFFGNGMVCFKTSYDFFIYRFLTARKTSRISSGRSKACSRPLIDLYRKRHKAQGKDQ